MFLDKALQPAPEPPKEEPKPEPVPTQPSFLMGGDPALRRSRFGFRFMPFDLGEAACVGLKRPDY